MARRRNTVTRWLEDMIDDTKDFVDDLLDRAKDVEEDVKDAARKVVDNDDDEGSSSSKNRKKATADAANLASLHAAVAELTTTVNKLAELQLATATRTTKSAAA